MALVEVSGMTYHVDNNLYIKWNKIKDGKLKKMDNDRVYIVDGRERTGKSVFTMQQACAIDPTLIDDLSRICFSAEEFLEAIRKTDSDDKTTKCIIFDEAFRGLSSRGAMSKINKTIIQALMEVGQKNLVLWIVLPSFFMLDIYPAMLRSNSLFHIAQDKKSKKRVFYIYPYKKKGLLYQNGIRKGWSYDIITKNKGYFYNSFPATLKDKTGNTFYEEYLKKKRKSLIESEKTLEEEPQMTKHQLQRDILIYQMVEEQGKTQREVAEYLKSNGMPITREMISMIISKMKEAKGLKPKISYEIVQNSK